MRANLLIVGGIIHRELIRIFCWSGIYKRGLLYYYDLHGLKFNPPDGSKNDALIFRSVNSIVIVPVDTGKALFASILILIIVPSYFACRLHGFDFLFLV